MTDKRKRDYAVESSKDGKYVCAIWHTIRKEPYFEYDVPYGTEYNSWGEAIAAIRQMMIDNGWKIVD